MKIFFNNFNYDDIRDKNKVKQMLICIKQLTMYDDDCFHFLNAISKERYNKIYSVQTCSYFLSLTKYNHLYKFIKKHYKEPYFFNINDGYRYPLKDNEANLTYESDYILKESFQKMFYDKKEIFSFLPLNEQEKIDIICAKVKSEFYILDFCIQKAFELLNQEE